MANGSSVTELRYLLDTNVCIYLLEGLSDKARKRVEACAPGEVASSVICYAEVMRGIDAANVEAVAKTERLFAAIPAMDFGRDAALCYAKLAFRRHSFDRLIAAHALSLGVVLITNNEAGFADVPGLKVENWTLAA
jgi:tRNA(fMet)-specific endonuclease VapC